MMKNLCLFIISNLKKSKNRTKAIFSPRYLIPLLHTMIPFQKIKNIVTLWPNMSINLKKKSPRLQPRIQQTFSIKGQRVFQVLWVKNTLFSSLFFLVHQPFKNVNTILGSVVGWYENGWRFQATVCRPLLQPN